MNIHDNIATTTGDTPLARLNNSTNDSEATVLAKLEFFNPVSCVKERIAKHMVETAEKEGKLKPGGVIIEPTSGNTGVGLAMMAAAKGYALVITMPDSMSIERRLILEHFGARIVLTPGDQGMTGAINKARELLEQNENSFMPNQFENPANVEAHRLFTAEEIWRDTGGDIDAFVAGVGTGGTITGVGSVLKERNPSVKIIAVEPAASAVLSGEPPGKHAIQGIGAGFIPAILDQELIDEVARVSDEDAFAAARKMAYAEGIFCGVSSGAAAHAALDLAARDEFKGKTIVALFPDTGERYLSTQLFL